VKVEGTDKGMNFTQTVLLGSIAGLGAGLLGPIAFERRIIRSRPEAGQVLSPTRLALMVAAGA
jgi:hypothetical protein